MSFFVSSLLFSAVSCGVRKQEEAQPTVSAVLLHTPPSSVTARPEITVTPVPATPTPVPQDSDIVRIRDYIPEAVVDFKYATDQNFTGKVIYDFSEAYTRYGTVLKLMQAQKLLAEKGYFIKIWDAYRPVSAQFRLWEVCPDGNYVSNPNIGYSNHTRGCALDLTLVDSAGNELEMPSSFDDFTAKADRDYSDVSQAAAANAQVLEDVMQSCGFVGYSKEWWHFNDTVKYEPELTFQPQ